MDYEDLMEFHNKENPFTREMGVKIIEIREGYAKLKLGVKKSHTNALGVVHGGCLFTLADSVCGVAASSYGGQSVTVNASINYLSPRIYDLKQKEIAKIMKKPLGTISFKYAKAIKTLRRELQDERF